MSQTSMDEYRESVRPAIDCPYEMRTERIVEMSYGIVWDATLLRGGQKIGFVEDHGDGSGAWPTFTDKEHRITWDAWLKEAYPDFDGDASETAVTHLMFVEDEAKSE